MPKLIVNGQVDLMLLLGSLLGKRFLILKIVLAFIFTGLVVALTAKEEFTVIVKVLPESNESSIPKLGSLSGLAGLSGINLPSLPNDESISPLLYEEVVTSTPFIEKLLYTPIYFENVDTTVSSFLYFKELDKPTLSEYILNYTIFLPFKINEWIREDEGMGGESKWARYSKKDWKILQKFKAKFSVLVDQETGMVEVTVNMPDPVATSQISKLLLEEIRFFVEEYKTQKYVKTVEFLENQLLEAERGYANSRKALATFSYKNRNVVSEFVEIERENLKNNVDFDF